MKELELTLGQKITIFSISTVMQITQRKEFTVINKDERGYIGQPKNKQKSFYINQEGKELIIMNGWNIPIFADSEVGGFSGNDCFNLIAEDIEIVKELLEYLVISSLPNKIKGKILFTPLNDINALSQIIYPEIEINHPVINDLKSKRK